MDLSVEEILKKAGIFQGVPDEIRKALTKKLVPVAFAKDSVIFSEGQAGEELYIIVAGKVKIGKHSETGRENFITLMGPSDMFGELSVFDPGPRTSTAIALTEVKAVTMNWEMLTEWITLYPQLARQLLRVLARRLRRTNNAIADFIFTDVPGRVAKALLGLANKFGDIEKDGIRVHHDLTQQELAGLVGASRETVNKTLADFASRGWIKLESKSVLVTDVPHLTHRSR